MIVQKLQTLLLHLLIYTPIHKRNVRRCNIVYGFILITQYMFSKQNCVLDSYLFVLLCSIRHIFILSIRLFIIYDGIIVVPISYLIT